MSTDNIVPFSTIDNAVVKRVQEYGADMELVQTGARAFLHWTRFTDDSISPPLTNYVRDGDVLPVAVRHFDRKHGCWEVSRRAYLRFQKLAISSLKQGGVQTAEIQHATEFGCTLKIQGMTAYLPPPRAPWSKYRILFESGRLEQGRLIDVVIGRWNPKVEGLEVHLPKVSSDQPFSNVHYAEVILLRPRYVKKHKNKLQSVVYAQLEGQNIARVYVQELLDTEAAFPIGSKIPIYLKEGVDRFTGLIDASIAWEFTQFSTPNVPLVGEVRVGVVVWLSPYGASCLLDNRAVGFLHRSTVIGPHSERLDSHLNLGDTIEVKVIDQLNFSQGSNNYHCNLEFVRRLEKFTEEQTEESILLDLAAIRRVGATGGFTRDNGFRWSVLDAYDHCCCICGKRYTVCNSSAMEAAHVVPRSNRGSNLLQNALCLCPIHHWAFDKGLLSINDDLSIRVAEAILASGDEGRWLAELHEQRANIGEDATVSRQALAWHRRNTFLDG